jgi:glucose-6-phosphate 1-dehydrogenase
MKAPQKMRIRQTGTTAKPADPCTFVIFGSSGDMAHRLLVPALYNLAAAGLLPDCFALVGVARGDSTEQAFRADLENSLRQYAIGRLDEDVVGRLLNCVGYVGGDAEDPATYRKLTKVLERVERIRHTGHNRLFYVATPPASFAPIGRSLGETGLAREENGAWRRIIIEKPFGIDLASAQSLNRELLEVLDERQIYRIDHYLGKETVQNIMVLRFANGLFEPIWNRHHIDHVQITVAETLTVGNRGRFYDATGALRDMVPNHLFQLLSLVAMEPPTRFEAHAVRSEKAHALDAIHVPRDGSVLRDCVRGQYVAARVGDNEVEDYRKTKDVAQDSATETYVALKLMIDNWRWAGVPFYLRTGKALKARRTEVAIEFKQAPFAMFRNTPVDQLAQNFLVMSIQPDESIGLQFNAKVPGPTVTISGVNMAFNYRDFFESAPSSGYETLIYDCMTGDAILFQRADGIEAGWRAVQPFLDVWREAGSEGLAAYKAGSQGPAEADALLSRDGRCWRPIG